MTIVYATGNGAIRVSIVARSAAMRMLFKVKERNEIIGQSLLAGGNMWIAKFLPSRFTEYVQRAPFSYPKSSQGSAMKLRMAKKGELHQVWKRIVVREFHGWDPWTPDHKIPESLITQWLAKNSQMYGKRKYGARLLGEYSVSTRKAMREHIQAWAKKRTHEIARNLAADGVMKPLVQTGDLRDVFAKQANCKAKSTTKRSRLTIAIPRGDRQNRWATRILGLLPVWEFNAIVKSFNVALDTQIADRFTSKASSSFGSGPTPGIAAGFIQSRTAQKESAMKSRRA